MVRRRGESTNYYNRNLSDIGHKAYTQKSKRKYGNFLKKYLNKLEFKVSTKEAEKAEFRFWPVFEDGTEPKPDPRNKGAGV